MLSTGRICNLTTILVLHFFAESMATRRSPCTWTTAVASGVPTTMSSPYWLQFCSAAWYARRRSSNCYSEYTDCKNAKWIGHLVIVLPTDSTMVPRRCRRFWASRWALIQSVRCSGSPIWMRSIAELASFCKVYGTALSEIRPASLTAPIQTHRHSAKLPKLS